MAMHGYIRDPQSGAGNCKCGAFEFHRRHPHEFLPSNSNPDLCVCALPFEATPHRVHMEKISFIKYFVRGFEDVKFYGYGYSDMRVHPGYEDGHALGINEHENMDFEKAYNIGFTLFDARLKESK